MAPLRRRGGRNNRGVVTVRHRGGGHKRRYRVIDFRRDKFGVPGRVDSIEYDPNRSARIALVVYHDGEKRYIIAPVGLRVGDTVMSGPGAEIRPGNALPIRMIPLGTVIHNVEIYPGRGGQLVRSAGNSAQLVAKEGAMAQVRLPSGEVRLYRCELSCHDWSGFQSGPCQSDDGQGRTQSVVGEAVHGTWHCHGPGIASAWWW